LASLRHGVENGPGEADLVHWRRRVVEACIYGVDKNEMAVELAKLSLWLVTAAADKPLSFLDHHLRHGDSLVGAWLSDLERPPLSSSQTAAEGQEPLFDESAFTGDAGLAVKGLMTIERLPSEDIEDVYAKERTYREIRQTHLARWRELANLWVSAYFGNTMSREEYRDLALRLQGRSEESMLRESQAQPYLTHPALDQPDYFHWELEFPEVFFDEYGRSLGEAVGFDAVIGNPPYGARLSEIDFFANNYSLQDYQLDSYFLFMERALEHIRKRGKVGLIIPNTWLLNLTSSKIRRELFSNTTIETITHYQNQVFERVSVDTQVLVFSKQPFDDAHKIHIIIYESPEKQEEYTVPQERWRQSEGRPINIFEKPSIIDLADKLRKLPTLDDVSTITQGAKPFQVGKGQPPQTQKIVDEKPFVADKQVDATFRPLLRGSLIQRYTNYWQKEYWISFGNWLAEPRYSANYDVDEKIVIRQTGDSLVATLDREQFIVRDNLYTIVVDEGINSINLSYILAILNSSLLNWFYQQVVNSEKDEALAQVKRGHLAQLPIWEIAFSTPKDERTAVVQTAKSHYEAGELTAVLAWCASELENGRNDTIHDLLAYLAGQMIALNRAQQERVARFWLDLEGVLAEPDTFAKLRHKGKWAQSLHKNIPAARPYVDSDSRSTITLDASLGWNEEAFTGFVRELAGSVRRSSGLVDVYRDHAGEYGRLARQITTTDDLIDQIVYRLYGLTDDEIAIVEGA
jgi:hypothetical protein